LQFRSSPSLSTAEADREGRFGAAEGIDDLIPRRLFCGGSNEMLRWALIFLVIALVAALLGFGGLAGAATGIAKILFFIFLVIFVISLIMHLVRRV
jgi:uncharacterized membrane protein YtjA (UPF0391 family)